MMNAAHKSLLPAGLSDLLPQDAEHEASVIAKLMAHFGSHGFERVKPPLMEYEETLLAGAGAAQSGLAFRAMDPISQKMLALRADMTPQVARIATSRLAGVARPLRLSYSGQVLLVKGSQLRPERQFAQAGIELIGSNSLQADVEVALLATEGLTALGVPDVSIDLAVPTLVPTLLAELGLSDSGLADSLDHKDAAAVKAVGGDAAKLLTGLLRAVGSADRALAVLAELALPPKAGALVAQLAEMAGEIRKSNPDLVVTIDPTESRGFQYHTGVSYTLFAKGSSGELGRGGRYLAAGQEPATGASLFMDTVLAAVPPAAPKKRIFVPMGTDAAVAQALRNDGYVTVFGLECVADLANEATRLGCTYVLSQDGVKSV